jgi:hypothetical protein
MYYAQVNNNGIVGAITETSTVINLDYMIEITFLDETLLGKQYQNGEFIDVTLNE